MFGPYPILFITSSAPCAGLLHLRSYSQGLDTSKCYTEMTQGVTLFAW